MSSSTNTAPVLRTGIADSAVFGPEAEFFIFDNVQFDHKSNGTFYSVDGEEGIWNSGKDEGPNLGYKPRQMVFRQPILQARPTGKADPTNTRGIACSFWYQV